MEGEQPFSTHELPGGLRVVCAPGRTDVVYLGIAVGAGTRHELPSESGMAHFTEHMSFKGTVRRSARQVISCMESVGGDLNAFTEELNREVEVVADEIESYRDQPSELIFDEFESLMFPGHPLGRNILGDADTLRTFRSADMQCFVRRLYHPGRMVPNEAVKDFFKN